MLWFGKSKKKKAEDAAHSGMSDDTYEKALLQQKKELEEKLEACRRQAAKQKAEFSLWEASAGGMTMVGGLMPGAMGTPLSSMSVDVWMGDRRDVRRLRKQLETIDRSLEEYHKLKTALSPSVPPAARPAHKKAAAQFNPPALPEKPAGPAAGPDTPASKPPSHHPPA